MLTERGEEHASLRLREGLCCLEQCEDLGTPGELLLPGSIYHVSRIVTRICFGTAMELQNVYGDAIPVHISIFMNMPKIQSNAHETAC